MKEENTLMSFSSEEFGEVRTVVIDGKPWFFSNDVAKALGYVKSSNAINMHVREKHRKALKYKACPDSQLSKMLWCDNDFSDKIFIDEPGVYALIFQCKLENAERFQDWVYEEVLPAIRRTGEYKVGKKDKIENKENNESELLQHENHSQLYVNVIDADDKFDRIKAMHKYFDYVRDLLKEVVYMKDEENDKLLASYITYKGSYYNLLDLMKSEENLKYTKGTTTLRDTAKFLSRDGIIIGEKQLKNILRSKGVFTPDNKPYQKYIEAGWFLMTPVCSEYEIDRLITVTGLGLMELNRIIHKYFNKSIPACVYNDLVL